MRSKREPSSWTPGSGHICSAHFTDDSYEEFGVKLAGFSSKLVLKKSTVPSIKPAPTPEQLSTARRVKRKLPLSEEKPNSKEKDPQQQSNTTSKKKKPRVVQTNCKPGKSFLCNVPLIWGLRVLDLLLLHLSVNTSHSVFGRFLSSADKNVFIQQLLTDFERINEEEKETAALVPSTSQCRQQWPSG